MCPESGAVNGAPHDVVFPHGSGPERVGIPGDFCLHTVTIATPWGAAACDYLLSVPQTADQEREEPGRPWPVLLFLTGKAEIRNAHMVKDLIDGDKAMDAAARAHSVVIVPLVKEDSALFQDRNRVNVEALWLLLRTALGRLRSLVDCQRVCVTGYSLGADAALQLALRYGSCLAAVALFCGTYDFLPDEEGVEAAEQLRHLAVRAFHAISDTYVPVARTEAAFAWMCSRWGREPSPPGTVSLQDPAPPKWDASARLQFDVTECGSSERSMWLLQDYVLVSEDSWNGWRQKRKHVFWPLIYLQEETFGLFRWLRGHRSRANLVLDLAFKASLRRSLPCCDVPSCPAAGLGFCTSIATAAVGDDAERQALLVGPGFHLDDAESPLQLWNNAQAAHGWHEFRVMAGDLILQVNGLEDARAMEAELQDPTKLEVDILLLRPFGLEQGSGYTRAVAVEEQRGTRAPGFQEIAGGHCQQLPAQKRQKTGGHSAGGFVAAMHRRGAFQWILLEGEAVDLDAAAAMGLPPQQAAALRLCADVERSSWLTSWQRCQRLCSGFLTAECRRLCATLEAKQDEHLGPLVRCLLLEPRRQLDSGRTLSAWWGLCTAEQALALAGRSPIYVLLLVTSLRQRLAAFLGGTIPIALLPRGSPRALDALAAAAAAQQPRGRPDAAEPEAEQRGQSPGCESAAAYGAAPGDVAPAGAPEGAAVV